MPLTPQLSNLSQIRFAVSRGIDCTGILEFQGKHYDIFCAQGRTQVREMDYSCMGPGLTRWFGKEQHNPAIPAIEKALAEGQILRKQGVLTELSRPEMASFVSSGLSLSNGDFTGCDFSDLDLYMPNIMPGGIVAKNANFKNCNFREARLVINLDGAKFENCDLEDARFYSIRGQVKFTDCNLTSTGFTGLGAKDGCESKIDGSSFVRCTLNFAQFGGTSLVGASFTDCTSTQLELNGANLTGAKFYGFNASIPQVPAYQKYGPPIKTLLIVNGTRMSDTRFEKCNLQGMSFHRANIQSVIFRETNLGGCDICVTPDWDQASKRSMNAGYYIPLTQAKPALGPVAPAAALPAARFHIDPLPQANYPAGMQQEHPGPAALATASSASSSPASSPGSPPKSSPGVLRIAPLSSRSRVPEPRPPTPPRSNRT